MYLNGNVKSIENRMFEAILHNNEIVSGNAYSLDIYDSNYIINFKEDGMFKEGFYLDENGDKRKMYIDSKKYNYAKLFDVYVNELKEVNLSLDKNENNYKSKKFDDKLNLIEYTVLDNDGTFEYKILRKFDDFSNITEEKSYTENGKLEAIINCKFDENQNIIKFTQKNFQQKIEFEYDYKYEFDSNNNWTRKIVFEKKIPIKIVERKIYYW